jgi:hypothetical protein
LFGGRNSYQGAAVFTGTLVDNAIKGKISKGDRCGEVQWLESRGSEKSHDVIFGTQCLRQPTEQDATTSEKQRPSELEETDPIYRVVVAPVVANWETSRSRAPRPRPTEATTEGALQSTAAEGVIERSVRRRVATGLQSTSSGCTHSGPPPTPAGSTPGGSVVVRPHALFLHQGV